MASAASKQTLSGPEDLQGTMEKSHFVNASNG